jgi:hypothetical protein
MGAILYRRQGSDEIVLGPTKANENAAGSKSLLGGARRIILDLRTLQASEVNM